MGAPSGEAGTLRAPPEEPPDASIPPHSLQISQGETDLFPVGLHLGETEATH